MIQIKILTSLGIEAHNNFEILKKDNRHLIYEVPGRLRMAAMAPGAVANAEKHNQMIKFAKNNKSCFSCKYFTACNKIYPKFTNKRKAEEKNSSVILAVAMNEEIKDCHFYHKIKRKCLVCLLPDDYNKRTHSYFEKILVNYE